jgi:chromosome segregation protein
MSEDKGTHFYRCDFQVHTPRDAQWTGPRPKNEDERKAYAQSFVAKCREIGLQAVAITDHHDLTYAGLIRSAAATELDFDGDPIPERDRLVVFPGVELTVAVPCQALLILDANLPDDRLPLVLEALAIEQHDPAADRLPDVKRLEHFRDLKDVYDTLNQRDWLRGRFIVLPNVTDSGHGGLLRKDMSTAYKDMPCVGGYIDGSISKLGTGVTNIVTGKDKAWGSKAIALFQTSDSRSATFENLGKHSTWIKWAEPTAEALRQACLGRESRISQEPPQVPSVYVSRVVASNSKFMGPVDLVLNSQYNALIGGRGTGKSTLLDYLRWALCDQPADASDDDLANPSARRRKLITETLVPVGGEIEVYFTINGIEHVVRRTAATDDVLLKVGDETFVKASEADVRALLPIHAYSQKQLSSVSLRTDELTRFVTAPIQRQLDAIDQQLRDVSDRLRENYATLQRARGLDASMARLEFSVRSLAEQAANLRGELTGLTDADRVVLDSKPSVDHVREQVADWDRDLSEIADATADLLQSVDEAIERGAALVAAPETVSTAVEAIRAENQLALSSLRNSILSALELANASVAEGGAQATAVDNLMPLLDAFDASYQEVKDRSTTHETQLNELASIEEQRKSAADLLARQRRERGTLSDPGSVHDNLRAQFVDLQAKRSTLLAAECDGMTERSGGLLRATISRGRGLRNVAEKFRMLVQGSGLRAARIDTFFEKLGEQGDLVGAWELSLRELEVLMLLSEGATHTSELTPTLSRLELPVADQNRIRSRITPDGWLDLALTALADEPVFEYQRKEEEFIAFSSASAGQQATALLRVLLAQSGMPLIIDQPEEDLDSEVVQDVIVRIARSKQGRQIIFASHNANLVVNGDAELVVVCANRQAGDQSGGKVALEGAIDMPEVRDAITRIMEGGEKAFRLRHEKYGY